MESWILLFSRSCKSRDLQSLKVLISFHLALPYIWGETIIHKGLFVVNMVKNLYYLRIKTLNFHFCILVGRCSKAFYSNQGMEFYTFILLIRIMKLYMFNINLLTYPPLFYESLSPMEIFSSYTELMSDILKGLFLPIKRLYDNLW